MTYRLAALLVAAVTLSFLNGCGPADCAANGTIEPGVGVAADGASLCLGDTLEDATKRMGEPSSTVDLGAAGVRVAWDGVVAFLGSAAEDAVVQSIQLTGVDATTTGGIGAGSDEAAVRSALGDGIADPFTGAWVYKDLGIALQWRDGAVSEVHLFTP